MEIYSFSWVKRKWNTWGDFTHVVENPKSLTHNSKEILKNQKEFLEIWNLDIEHLKKKKHIENHVHHGSLKTKKNIC